MRIKGILSFAVVLSAAFYLAGCASSKAKTEGAAPPPPPSEVVITPSPEETARREEMERERARNAELESQKKAEEQRRLSEQAASTTFIDGLGTVYFDFDKYDVKPEYRGVLAKNAEIIKDHQSMKVAVEGHCDERGTAEYNLALGERRALSVKKYLLSLGVGESNLYTISYGEEKPADPGHNKEAWAKNRRVQFGKVE
ncbi:MAG: peptidoglycan-associated lipoprotein Pal [Nitrospinae bacterium]|nr:peptidoglycan-associated lipoprotein Pal [Nitrospinota bacterium]